METTRIGSTLIIKSRDYVSLKSLEIEFSKTGRIVEFGDYPLTDGRYYLCVTEAL